LDLSLLHLAFSLLLTVASRLLHPYSTDDKTSRLMVKKFSTVRDTQRGSQSYMEKRRGRREIEDFRVGKILQRRKWQPTPVFLLGDFHGPEEPGRLQSMGSQRVDTTE